MTSPPRTTVLEFLSLGPLPPSTASVETIAQHQALLQRISAPVTDEEASMLVDCFGQDDCYGLAWTLLHLIETAPSGSPIATKPADTANEWLRRLWDRSHR